MIVVTGGAGFIGSNLVRGLNRRGRQDILVVDDLGDGRKFANLAGCDIADYWDRAELEERLRAGAPLPEVEAVFHQGACSDTTQWDGRVMMDTNYRYSKMLLEHCARHAIALIYASSAAVYGAGRVFEEAPENEAPLNVYAYSKHLFDRYVRARLDLVPTQVVGLRYFNVYGPGEAHKARMASVAWQLREGLRRGESLKLFRGSDGYGPGEQRRDFIHVDDVVEVNLWCLDHPGVRGIFNVGTGRAQAFNEVAEAIIAWYRTGRIEYVEFPSALLGRYQSFTQADISRLRGCGFDRRFLDVGQGVARYMDALDRLDGGLPG